MKLLLSTLVGLSIGDTVQTIRQQCEGLNCEDDSEFCSVFAGGRIVGCMEPEFPECPASCHDISFDDENFGPDCISKLSSPSAMCSIKSEKVQAPSESDSSQTEEDKYKAQCAEKCPEERPICVFAFEQKSVECFHAERYEDLQNFLALCDGSYTADCLFPSESTSCDSGNIFQVTCLENFKVKVEIKNEQCLKDEYPGITALDLIVKASEKVDSSHTCTSFTDAANQEGLNFLYKDENLSEAMDSKTTTFYFDGKKCGEDPKVTENDTKTQLVYSAQIGTYVHSESILTAPAMLFSAITCTYDQAGYDFKALNGFDLYPEDDKDQVADVTENTDLKITTTKFRKVSDDKYDPIVNDDKVVLGEEVKIVFTSASSLLDIHIEDCFAHNNKYKTADGDFLLVN